MDALVIHSPGDLRVEDIRHAGARRRPVAGARARRRHLRLGPALLPARRLRHRAREGADGAGPRGRRHDRRRWAPACRGFAVGERVAISPSRPCGPCRYCQQGLQNHCLDMRYYGSAMRTPHVQGAFRQQIVVEPSAGVQAGRRRSATPRARWPSRCPSALHAVRRAGPLLGKRVLVTGCGPIGALIVIAARRAGATQIIATDVGRASAAQGAEGRRRRNHQRRRAARGTGRLRRRQGQFDVLFEASGNERALRGAFDALRPRGVIVQVGLRRRDDAADQHHRRQGVRPARRLPLPRGVRGRGRTAEQGAGRRQAADLGDAVLPRRRACLRAGR